MAEKVKKRGRPAGADSQLNSERIVACARKLLKEEGKVPSIRRLSGELGVDAMAIYYYFPSKAILLEAVTVDLVSDIYMPDETSGWKNEIALLCKSYLLLLQNHPGLLQTILSTTAIGPPEVFRQRFDMALSTLTLEADLVSDVIDLLVDYLHGFALAIECQKGGGPTEAHLKRSLNLILQIIENHLTESNQDHAG